MSSFHSDIEKEGEPMDKVERLISIIMILLRKEVVSASEFAQLFNVSKRTILRDMETLSLSNIPIYSINGVHGGYGIMDEYKVDKRLLSNSDLENILTALGGLEQILSEEVEITVKKIEAMISPMAPKGTIKLSFYDWEGRSEIRQTLKTSQEAILKRRLVSFDYIDKNGATTKRTVEPYQLHFSESSWYLKGFCLQRMGYRTFKLSRIDHLHMTEQTFSARDEVHEPDQAASYLPELVEVKLLISPVIKDQFIERYGRKRIERFSSDYLSATIQLPQNGNGFHFLASFGTNLQVVEPKSYVEEFRNYLSKMLEQYT